MYPEGEGYDGKYCADVEYYNPNTGTSSTYTLNVEVEDNTLVTIYWPSGGWLDESHFEPQDISDGNCSFTSDVGYDYEVTITGEPCTFDENEYSGSNDNSSSRNNYSQSENQSYNDQPGCYNECVFSRINDLNNQYDIPNNPYVCSFSKPGYSQANFSFKLIVKNTANVSQDDYINLFVSKNGYWQEAGRIYLCNIMNHPDRQYIYLKNGYRYAYNKDDDPPREIYLIDQNKQWKSN